jgi:hypothetical protein
MTRAWRGALALVFTAVSVLVAIFAPPVAQPLSYHDFADQRALAGIPHFGDVASNLPFLLVGIAGLWALRPGGRVVFVRHEERWPYLVFFAGVLFTAFSSSYYHLAPDDNRLVWDRLPMTLAFMGLVCGLIADRVDVKLGRALTMPAVVVGLASVWYWQWTRLHGVENLMPYLVLQGYAMVMVLILAFAYPSKYTAGSMIFGVVGLYVAAKLFELGDKVIFAAGGLVSGHTVKHLVAGLATYWVLRMLSARRPRAEGSAT